MSLNRNMGICRTSYKSGWAVECLTLSRFNSTQNQLITSGQLPLAHCAHAQRLWCQSREMRAKQKTMLVGAVLSIRNLSGALELACGGFRLQGARRAGRAGAPTSARFVAEN